MPHEMSRRAKIREVKMAYFQEESKSFFRIFSIGVLPGIGECPKNRFITTTDGETELNYLCEWYRLFFTHLAGPMEFMVMELQAGRALANVMKYLERNPSSGE
jgi:hypothetical protein